MLLMTGIKQSRACQLCDDWPAASADIQRRETAPLRHAVQLCEGDFPIDLMESRQCSSPYIRVKLTATVFDYRPNSPSDRKRHI